MTDRQFFILVACSAIAIVLVVIGMSHINFGLHLTPVERGILLFRQEKIMMTERHFTAVPALKNPMDQHLSEKKSYPSVKLSDIAPREQQHVSLVLIRGDKRIAIIDNLVVREGDGISQGRVARIERNGVLIKNREGEQWLKIR